MHSQPDPLVWYMIIKDLSHLLSAPPRPISQADL